MEASQHTPYQAKLIREAKERKERLAAKAKPDKAVMCLSASQRAAAFERPIIKLLPPSVVAETPAEWAARQIQRYQPWFSIESESDAPTMERPTIGIIQRIVGRYFDISLNALLSPRREAPVVYARQISMFLAKELTLKSLPEIGRRFGNRDHTTVLHAIRKITRAELEDLEVAQDLTDLRTMIKEAL